MNEAEIGVVLHEALVVTLKLAGPPLLVGLAVGVLVSILQAMTQVNEAAVAYVPKALALFAALALLGPFYYETIIQYGSAMFARLVLLGGQ